MSFRSPARVTIHQRVNYANEMCIMRVSTIHAACICAYRPVLPRTRESRSSSRLSRYVCRAVIRNTSGETLRAGHARKPRHSSQEVEGELECEKTMRTEADFRGLRLERSVSNRKLRWNRLNQSRARYPAIHLTCE